MLVIAGADNVTQCRVTVVVAAPLSALCYRRTAVWGGWDRPTSIDHFAQTHSSERCFRQHGS